jgi:hypothetical protein
VRNNYKLDTCLEKTSGRSLGYEYHNCADRVTDLPADPPVLPVVITTVSAATSVNALQGLNFDIPTWIDYDSVVGCGVLSETGISAVADKMILGSYRNHNLADRLMLDTVSDLPLLPDVITARTDAAVEMNVLLHQNCNEHGKMNFKPMANCNLDAGTYKLNISHDYKCNVQTYVNFQVVTVHQALTECH